MHNICFVAHWRKLSPNTPPNTHCVLSCTQTTSEKGFALKGNNSLPREANYLFIEWTPFQKEGKNDFDRASAPENAQHVPYNTCCIDSPSFVKLIEY